MQLSIKVQAALAVFFLAGTASVLAQNQGINNGNNNLLGQDKFNAITTAVPFLTITPDARTSGLGEAGVSNTPDANSPFYNTGKLAFAEKPIAASFSISPWLRNLGFNDMYLAYLSGYYKIRKQDAITAGFTYFNLGSLTFTDQSGNAIRDFNPQEFAIQAGYSRQLTNNFALGVAGKFIYSNLTGNFSNSADIQARPGITQAVDLSGYYKKEISIKGTPGELSFGGSIVNIGPKISYTNNNRRDFIPTTLRVGGRLTLDLDPYNKLSFLLDASKLMVPTPDVKVVTKITETPSGGLDTNYIDSNFTANKNLISGMFGSFNDAPRGLSEELEEIMISSGVEYWYDNLFALRAGYFNENKYKGNRKYFTAGIGLRYQQFGLDISYLVPASSGNNNPLANTLRFSLLFDFNAPQKEESVTE